MTLDPEHRDEIARWADEWVQEHSDMFRSLSEKDPRYEGEFLWFQIHSQDGICDRDVLCSAIEDAKTDATLFDALCWIGSERIRYKTRSEVLPPDLRHFLADVLIGKFKRPAKRPGPSSPDFYRNQWVFVFVALTARKFGLNPTRNDAKDIPDSACDIVAEALGRAGLRLMSYGRVKKAWQHHKARWKQDRLLR